MSLYRFLDRFVFPLLWGFQWVLRRMPRSVALRLGAFGGDVAFHLLRGRRRIALTNLDIAYGDRLSRRRKLSIIRESFRHLGMNAVEFFRFDDLDEEYLDAHVEIDGLEHLREAFSEGRGVIAISAHLGHFQLIPAVVNLLGIGRCIVVGRPIRSGWFNRETERLREAAGIWSVPPKKAILPVLLALRRGDAVGIVLDQNTGWARAVFVDFFGREAATTPGAAVLAKKSKAPVLGVFAYRGPDNGHRIVATPIVPFVEKETEEETIRYNTQVYTKMIESFVRDHPEQWFWVHRRWRTRPQIEWHLPKIYD